MANLRLFMERYSGRSSSKAGFTMRGGAKSVRNFVIGDDGQVSGGSPVNAPVTSSTEVYDAVKELMGYTEPHEDGTKLKRVLPLGDPFWQWLYVESIGSITGVGRPTLTASNPFGILEAPTLDYYMLQPCYEFNDVTFSQRPYATLSDDAIPTGSIRYADLEGVESDKTYAQEWLRYVDVETVPGAEFITAQAGQFLFDVASTSAPDGRPAGTGQLRMLVKKKVIRMTWYQVPYAYVEGSGTQETYIMQALGCVNQYDWWKYPRGSMLLEAVGVNRYSPILPKMTGNLSGTTTTATFANEKTCDITFIFSYLNPPLGKDAAGNAATPSTPTGPLPGPIFGDPGPIQVVQAGHNLVPYAHQMQWFYARTRMSGYANASNRPIYPSIPMQLIWTNPNV